MTIGLVGRKCGMTRVFTEDGSALPVTVIEVLPNRISQVKSQKKDGYNAVQVTTGEIKSSRVNKPLAGHLAKAGVVAGRLIKEFRINEEQAKSLKLGSELGLEQFKEGQVVDVTGISKGKGFQGGVKRWHFKMQDATHGNSLSHRAIGSVGQNQTPGRVFKGKKMAGHMGNHRCTTQNLVIIKIDQKKQVLLIKGSVAGCSGGDVMIRSAVKASV